MVPDYFKLQRRYDNLLKKQQKAEKQVSLLKALRKKYAVKIYESRYA